MPQTRLSPPELAMAKLRETMAGGTDFVVYGVAEPGSSVRYALLPSLQNHRRCLLEPVLLTSNHAKEEDFMLTVIAVEETARLDSERAMLPAADVLVQLA